MSKEPKTIYWAFASLCLAIGGIAAINLIYGSSEVAPAAAAPQARAREGITRLPCLCAADYSSVYPVLKSYSDRDLQAQYGLVGRGKALLLSERTQISVLTRGDGVAAVLVNSGRHSGERCYLPEQFIQ